MASHVWHTQIIYHAVGDSPPESRYSPYTIQFRIQFLRRKVRSERQL